eukprot:3013502-Amphidinium_carterae.2
MCTTTQRTNREQTHHAVVAGSVRLCHVSKTTGQTHVPALRSIDQYKTRKIVPWVPSLSEQQQMPLYKELRQEWTSPALQRGTTDHRGHMRIEDDYIISEKILGRGSTGAVVAAMRQDCVLVD